MEQTASRSYLGLAVVLSLIWIFLLAFFIGIVIWWWVDRIPPSSANDQLTANSPGKPAGKSEGPAHIRGMLAVETAGLVIDGRLDDWKKAVQYEACADLEKESRKFHTIASAMYDSQHLYLAVQFVDNTPLANKAVADTDENYGWRGDSLQLRIRDGALATEVDAWFCAVTRSSVLHYRQTGDPDGIPNRLYATADTELGDGFAMDFARSEHGYVQELRIPWKLIAQTEPPKLEKIRLQLQFNWGNGDQREHAYATNLQPGVKNADNLWKRPETFGDITLSKDEPQRVVAPEWKQRRHKSEFDRSIELRCSADVRCIARIDANRLLLGTRTGEVLLADLRRRTTSTIHQLDNDSIRAVAVSPDADRFALGSKNHQLIVIDSKTRNPILNLEAHTSSVTGLAFSADGKILVSAALDGSLIVWGLATGSEVHRTRVKTGWKCVLFVGVDRVFAGNLDHGVYDWSLQTGEVSAMMEHEYAVRALAVCPKTGILASASDDMSVILWNPKSGARLRQLIGHTSLVTGVGFLSDGRLVTTSRDGSVRLWNVAKGEELCRLREDQVGLTSLCVDSDRIVFSTDTGITQLTR